LDPIGVALVALACIFGSALLAFLCRSFVSEQHLSSDSQDAMKQVTSLVATMSALVLGLMVASAKGSYDTRNAGLDRIAADIVQLDRAMAGYGPETREARVLLRQRVASAISRVWPESADQDVKPATKETEVGLGGLQLALYALSPANDVQKQLQEYALTIFEDLTQTRVLTLEQNEHSIPPPFLIVVVVWLSMIFFGFNLFTPNSKLVAVTMFAGAVCVSSALFLILELDTPLRGMMRISPAPLISALARIGEVP
jgi:hypothetical protein